MTVLPSTLQLKSRNVRYSLGAVALLSGMLVICMAFLNPTAMRITEVMYPDARPQPLLPHSASSFVGDDDGVFLFVAEVAVHHSIFSSGILRVSADDCLDVITVNGTVVDNKREDPETWRCHRDMQHRLDLSEHLRKGANRIHFTVANDGGRHGIAITPLFSPTAILAMTFCMAMFTYSLTVLAAVSVPKGRSMLSHPAGRMTRVGFIPAFGTVLLAWLSATNAGPDWLTDHLTPTLVTVLIPALLGISALDRSGPPLAAVRNYWCATASIACFLWSFHLLSVGQWSNPEIRWYAVAGLVIGLGATVSIKEILVHIKRSPRILTVISVAVAAPHLYWHFNLAMWGSVGIYTGRAVQGLLWLAGIATKIRDGAHVSKSGVVQDFYVYVSSPSFSVKIGSWCSGFEGTSYFMFLISLFVLLDWKLFAGRRHLWLAFLLTIPFALFVNALRIASLFLYAEWNVWRHGHSTAVWRTVEAFHSNIGWVVNSAAFAVLLPLVYRWARKSAKIS